MPTNNEGYAVKTGALVAADEAQFEKQKKVPLGELFRKALATGNMTMPAMIGDQWRLSRGIGRLNSRDYFRYRLYRPGLAPADKAAFISENLHWPVANLCCDRNWRAATGDKWLSYLILGAAGIATPPTQAVYDTTARSFGATRKLSNATDLGHFLATEARYPLFAKPNSQLASFGAFAIQSFGDGLAQLHSGEAMPASDIAAKLMGQVSYVLQDRITNHPAIAAFADGLATVRLVNFVESDHVNTYFAALKIPANGNVADNFWRPGNLLANVDVATGKVTRVISGHGPDEREVETGLGLEIPFWREALELNQRAARLFAPVAYNSLDMCLTPNGPLVVEINSSGSFDLPQSASGKGMLTTEVLQFFARKGWKPALTALQSRRS